MSQDREYLQQQLAHTLHLLQESEARFNNIIEKNADGIVIVDVEGRVHFVNPAAEALLGRDKQGLLGETLGIPIVAGETVTLDIVRSPADTIVAEMRVVETTWEGNLAYVASLRDVTARVQMSTALERARDELERRVEVRTAELARSNASLQAEIVERRRIVAALQVSEARFRTIFNAANAIILAHDLHGDVLYINPYASKLLGYQASDIIGQPISRLMVDDDDAAADSMRERLIQDPTTHVEGFEQYLLTREGEHVLIDWNVTALQDAEGRVEGILGIGQDITARKQAEAALRSAYDELEGRVVERTAALNTTNQQLQQEIVERKRAKESLDWESSLNATLAELARLLITSASLEDISYLILKHAKQLTWSRFGFVGYIDPETGYLICPTMTRDIWDACEVPDKSIVFKERKGLWGWVLENRRSILINQPHNDPRSTGVPQGHIPVERFLSAPAMMGELLVGQIALVNPLEDYTERDLILVERLATLYALAVQRSRTDAQLHEYAEHLEQLVAEKVQELEQERAKVVQSGKLAALGEMATGVAHELNQPLTAMLFDAEYIKTLMLQHKQVVDDASVAAGASVADNAPPLDIEELYEIGENLVNDIGRCRRIINHLRDFSRTSDVALGPVDLNIVIENTFILIGERLRLHNVNMRQRLATDLPLILGSPYKLEQVFLNLISNAEYAMAQKAASVQADGSATSSYIKNLEIVTYVESEVVMVDIRDNGTGIALADQEHLFDPFFTTKPVGEGTGLGLSISYGIVTEAGGEITFESMEGEGSMFRLCFPIVEEEWI